MRLIPYNIFSEIFDIVIIGGGINGAGIALDAASRGFKVLLLEKNDFGSGITSYSTKLIHGGLRYLSQFEVSFVRESLREREILLKNAPHMVRPVQFSFPIYKNGNKSYRELRTELFAYDLLSYDKSLQNHKIFKAKEFINIEPNIDSENLLAGAIFYDCQIVYPERLCLENILMAEKYGAIVLNHCKVTNIHHKKNKISGVSFTDNSSGINYDVLAKVVVNVTGPWVDSIIDLALPDSVNKIGGTKGSHIVVRKFNKSPKNGLYFLSKEDGRPVFVIPWRDYYLVGTTDIKNNGNPDNVSPEKSEIDYLLNSVNKIIPEANLSSDDILYSYSGIRPLPFVFDLPEESITRKHMIYDHEKNDKLAGFISIIGGQITTYRSLAKETVNLICEKLGKRIKKISCKTDKINFFGDWNKLNEFENLEEYILSITKNISLPEELKIHLFSYYGFKAYEILDFIQKNPYYMKKIHTNYEDITFQIHYGMIKEHAATAIDILMRRTTIGSGKTLGLESIEFVAEEMSKYNNWDSNRKNLEIKKYVSYIENKYLSFLNLDISKKINIKL